MIMVDEEQIPRCEFCDCRLDESLYDVVIRGVWHYCSDDCANLHQQRIREDLDESRDERPYLDDFLYLDSWDDTSQ